MTAAGCNVIEVKNLFKKFYIGTRERLTIFSTIRAKLSSEMPKREIWALKNINFEVKKGEMIAVIGPNGAGKTTLLRIIAGIMRQTHGEYMIEGNISTMFELGIGFNPRFTAIQNIYLYGARHGLSRKDIDRNLPQIIEFAELDGFMHAKLREYSSGMRQRLAFATIMQTAEDIIMVDEVLSVGDLAFQEKCVGAFKLLLDRGNTILFVAHGLGDAKRLCSRALYINKGEVKGYGPVEEIEELYTKDIQNEKAAGKTA